MMSFDHYERIKIHLRQQPQRLANPWEQKKSSELSMQASILLSLAYLHNIAATTLPTCGSTYSGSSFPCSGNGVCDGTSCVCNHTSNFRVSNGAQVAKFLGDQCEHACPLSAALLPCDGRATCSLSGPVGSKAAKCEHCATGYQGDACEVAKACPYVNAKVCYGHGVCSQGFCDCSTGYTDHDCSRKENNNSGALRGTGISFGGTLGLLGLALFYGLR